jgi:predicted DNA-binding protein (MmcQ/YjbR family)
MDIEQVTAYCLLKKGVSHGFPFGGDTLVFKVMDKMFCATGLESIPATINLKCDPDYAIQLREEHEDVHPGYHMNKTHWNTVTLEGELSDAFVCKLIDHSFDLVVSSFSKKVREEWQNL